jgi:hypothetical protein
MLKITQVTYKKIRSKDELEKVEYNIMKLVELKKKYNKLNHKG